jgi:hypothetical protein
MGHTRPNHWKDGVQVGTLIVSQLRMPSHFILSRHYWVIFFVAGFEEMKLPLRAPFYLMPRAQLRYLL